MGMDNRLQEDNAMIDQRHNAAFERWEMGAWWKWERKQEMGEEDEMKITPKEVIVHKAAGHGVGAKIGMCGYRGKDEKIMPWWKTVTCEACCENNGD